MDVRRLMARVCLILIPTRVSEAEQNHQIIRKIYMNMLPSTERVTESIPSIYQSLENQYIFSHFRIFHQV